MLITIFLLILHEWVTNTGCTIFSLVGSEEVVSMLLPSRVGDSRVWGSPDKLPLGTFHLLSEGGWVENWGSTKNLRGLRECLQNILAKGEGV